MQSGLDSGPLVLFDGSGGTVIVSPFRQFMAMSVQFGSEQGQTSASWGLLGKAAAIPKDFTVATALFYSPEGINKVNHFDTSFIENARSRMQKKVAILCKQR